MLTETLLAILVSLLAVKLEQHFSSKRPVESVAPSPPQFLPLGEYHQLESMTDMLRRARKPNFVAEIVQVLLTEIAIPSVTRDFQRKEIETLVYSVLPFLFDFS